MRETSERCSKTSGDKSQKLKSEVIFDVATNHVRPPAYQTPTVQTYDNNKFTSKRYNDYCIEDENMGSNKESIEEIHQKDNHLKSNQTYNKLTYWNS